MAPIGRGGFRLTMHCDHTPGVVGLQAKAMLMYRCITLANDDEEIDSGLVFNDGMS